MNRINRSAIALVLAGACLCGAAGAGAQQNGAPPGNKSPDDGASGKSAGVAGGAGAAGQSGTDPATLKRAEEARVQQKHAPGASAPGAAKRKDWKE
ncbi:MULTISPECIES: hypothetical protein [Caballeronia]|uniref:hypothetical protein n=1 Tax=Caballeronia TaxID=1827195 RepID=UPI00045EDF97|nr:MULTISPECIES: hypothetical protein [unclassified Caballeronia]MCE4547433.1 hypothetical protein [Caballeronia sp. PC1]MCE4575418.1 hypothetical protein [Caballeronia sp. CLC5]BAO92638.1 uncharacterized protein BRPE67_ECDS01410 [Burkholderia sp. RPE67]